MSDNPFGQQETQAAPTQPVQQEELAVEAIKLPSKGVLYPPQHPLHNCEFVEIRPMTAREEDILMSPAYLKQGTALDKLLTACLINKSIAPDSLLPGDRLAILVAIRVVSYGPEYPASTTCGGCNYEWDNSFDIGKLNVKNLGGQPITEGQNLFETILPASKKRVVFKLLTTKEDNELAKEAEARAKAGVQKENSITSSLIARIVDIDGVTDRAKIVSMVNNMIARDSRHLRKEYDKIEPSVEFKQEIECPKCTEKQEVLIPLGMSFFWPDLGA